MRGADDIAKVDVKLPEDYLLKISKLADKTDEIVPRVLEAGGEIVLAKVKSNLQSVIGKDTKIASRSTGELVRSLGLTKARMDRNGNWDIKVGFAESRSDGVSNAKIGNTIEYGKSGQPAKPFLKPAHSATKKTAIDIMKQKLDEEINNL